MGYGSITTCSWIASDPRSDPSDERQNRNLRRPRGYKGKYGFPHMAPAASWMPHHLSAPMQTSRAEHGGSTRPPQDVASTCMPTFGFHASHEQVHPSELLAAAQPAEEAGFDAAMSSDHFSPWSQRQGQSGFAWLWLGAAAATALPFGFDHLSTRHCTCWRCMSHRPARP